jgi:Tfp pilus assembly protein PilF
MSMGGTRSVDKVASSVARPRGWRSARGLRRWLLVAAVLLFIASIVLGGLVVRSLIGRYNAEKAPGAAQRQILEGIVRKQPTDVASRRLLAFAYQQEGRDQTALREYARILQSDPRDMAALYNSGVIYLRQGKDRQGVESLSKVLELEPSHTLAAKLLAEHYAATGEYQRIGSVVQAAVDAHPEMADLQYLSGLGYEKTGRTQEAGVRYRLALKLIPDMPEAKAALSRLEEAK